MTMIDRIPGLTDADLATLHGNARRLEMSSDVGRSKAAVDMLPVIEAELAQREAAKPKKAPPKRKPAAPKVAKAKKTAEVEDTGEPAPL